MSSSLQEILIIALSFRSPYLRNIHRSELLPSLCRSLSNSKSIGNVANRIHNRKQRDKDPKHVEEDQIHPHVHEVAAVEVDVAGEPLRAESHEAWYPLAITMQFF